MTAGIKIIGSGLWQYSTIMKYLPPRFQDPVFRSSLRRFEKTGKLSPRIIQLETLILDELLENDSSKIEIKARNLYLDLGHQPISRSAFTDIRLYRNVLETRGIFRWLCFRLMPAVFCDSYEISRGKLIIQVVRHWKVFKEEVLEKLYLSETAPSSFIEIDSYEYTHPNIKFKFSTGQIYLLGGEFAKGLDYGLRSNPNEKAVSKFLLGRMIFWDSRRVLNLIRQRESFSTEPRVLKFLQLFPDFINQISQQTKLLINVHPNAALTFDERLEGGHTSPDVLHHVDIWHQRFIVQGKTWHVVDSTCSPKAAFVAGHWQFLESIPAHKKHVYIKEPRQFIKVELKQAIYLLGRADENWFHFLLDTLPRYLQLREINEDVPVLVRSDLPETTISLIKKLIPHKVLFVSPKDLVSVEKLFFIAARSTVHDSVPTNGEDQVKFSPKALRDLQDWVLNSLSTELGSKFSDKIFIPRHAKYRNLINTDKLQEQLENIGFESIETNSDFYARQHSYFNQASQLVAPGGAVLANIVFMKPGSKVLVIRSWRDSNLLLWKKLAESCGVQFSEAIGFPTYYGRSTLARQHSNYFLPIWKVKKLLNARN
jgi:hypothetical protein